MIVRDVLEKESRRGVGGSEEAIDEENFVDSMRAVRIACFYAG